MTLPRASSGGFTPGPRTAHAPTTHTHTPLAEREPWEPTEGELWADNYDRELERLDRVNERGGVVDVWWVLPEWARHGA